MAQTLLTPASCAASPDHLSHTPGSLFSTGLAEEQTKAKGPLEPMAKLSSLRGGHSQDSNTWLLALIP
jgi:hypothetical protein